MRINHIYITGSHARMCESPGCQEEATQMIGDRLVCDACAEDDVLELVNC